MPYSSYHSCLIHHSHIFKAVPYIFDLMAAFRLSQLYMNLCLYRGYEHLPVLPSHLCKIYTSCDQDTALIASALEADSCELMLTSIHLNHRTHTHGVRGRGRYVRDIPSAE